jgi:hypothetical protein
MMTERKAKTAGLDLVILRIIIGSWSLLIYGKTAHKSTPSSFSHAPALAFEVPFD